MESSSKQYQQLQPEDRVTLSNLKQQNYSILAIAQVLQRPASTISRELRRNGSPCLHVDRHVRHYLLAPVMEGCKDSSEKRVQAH